MSTTVPTPRELQRRAALAHLDAEELRLEIAGGQASLDSSTSARTAAEQLQGALARLAQIAERLSGLLDVPIGIPVNQAAERLQVTAPTVRRWLREGLLQRVPDRKPVEIEAHSMIELGRALASVRAGYPSKQWSKALAAYLHDQDLQHQDWAAQGRRELERGELIER